MRSEEKSGAERLGVGLSQNAVHAAWRAAADFRYSETVNTAAREKPDRLHQTFDITR